MSDYSVSVVDFASRQLIGMRVRTSMETLHQDCEAVWQRFMPCNAGPSAKESYGVSVVINEKEFEYWATTEWEPLSPLPEQMERIDIPAGKYAHCPVPALDRLAEVYMHLYSEWPQEQSGYAFDESKPCLERYPEGWQPTDPLDIYMPLKVKQPA